MAEERPPEPQSGEVWYRGWEAGYEEMHARYTQESFVAYKGGADLDAPQVSGKTWEALLDEIDAQED